MEKLISEQIVDSILSQDKEAFVDAFNAAIAAKVSDALEVKKVEIASSLITPEMAVEEEVEQVAEQSNDALANELLGFEAAKGKKVAGREEILNKKSAEENKAAAISNAVKDKVKAKLNKVDTKPVMNANPNNQGK
jgi:hypothetical protein